jgi:hypothetical protein
LETTENALPQCIDGADNDLDGSTDLYDSDCAQYLPHVNVVISIINEEGESSIGTAGWIALYATDGNLPGASNTDHNYGLEQWGSLSATINLGPYHVTPRFSSTGYNLTMSPDCSGTIVAGDSKMCVITLTAIPPQLTIVKHVNNVENGTATASDFIINITGMNISTSTFIGSETGTTVTLHSGSYSVSDSGPSGYDETFSSGCSGSIGIGESKTCTITSSDVPLVENNLSLCTDNIDNDLDGSTDLYDSDCAQYIPHVSASINIINEENESSVGTSGWVALYATAGDLPGAYNPDRNYGLEGWGSVAATVNLGPFHITPRFGHDGYTLTMSNDCSGALVAGDSKMCVITLTAIPPQLTIIKHVVNNNGGIAVASDFTMNVLGTNVSTPTFTGSETGTTVTLHSGSYNVNENGPSGYTVLSGTNCSGSISLGESRICTITNDDVPPALILIKRVINDNSGTATTTDWNLSADGPTPISGYGFVTSEISNDFTKGVYTLSESGILSGYTASQWSCTGDITNIGNSITVDIGQNATCTITNDDNP